MRKFEHRRPRFQRLLQQVRHWRRIIKRSPPRPMSSLVDLHGLARFEGRVLCRRPPPRPIEVTSPLPLFRSPCTSAPIVWSPAPPTLSWMAVFSDGSSRHVPELLPLLLPPATPPSLPLLPAADGGGGVQPPLHLPPPGESLLLLAVHHPNSCCPTAAVDDEEMAGREAGFLCSISINSAMIWLECMSSRGSRFGRFLVTLPVLYVNEVSLPSIRFCWRMLFGRAGFVHLKC